MPSNTATTEACDKYKTPKAAAKAAASLRRRPKVRTLGLRTLHDLSTVDLQIGIGYKCIPGTGKSKHGLANLADQRKNISKF